MNSDKLRMARISRLPGPCYPLDVASHLAEHLLWMQLQGRSTRTLLHRRMAVVHLAEKLGSDPLHATYEALESWQLGLLEVSAVHVTHQTSLVRPYFRWLQAKGYRADNPAILLASPRRRRGVPRPIGEDRLAAAIRHAPARILPWLLLAGWSGLRAAEIAGLVADDFFADSSGSIWARLLGKGGYERHAPVPRWAWPTIAEAVAESGPAWGTVRGGRPLTPHHVSNYANRYLRSVGIPDKLHALRHRVATMTYQATRDLRLVQELLGHTSPGTTAIYTQVASGAVASAIAELPAPALPTPRATRHLRIVQTGERRDLDA